MNNRYKSAAMLRDNAKGFMNGNYARAIGVLMIFASFNYMASMIMSIIDEMLTSIFVSAGMITDTAVLVMDIIYGVLNIVVSILIAILSIGMNLFFLKIGCKAQTSVADLFAGFREDFSRSLQIAFRVSGLISIALLPATVLASYYMSTKQINAFYASMACFAVGGIIAIYISLTYEMSYFIMHDFAEYSSNEVLKACRKKMTGNRWRLFRLELSFIPYVLLGILTLGIGLLWVYPMLMEAKAQFYLDLMNPQKVSGEWERTV